MGTRNEAGTHTLTANEIAGFCCEGFVHLPAWFGEAEVAEPEVTHDHLLRADIGVQGRDCCDIAHDFRRAPEDSSIVAVMLPRCGSRDSETL